MKIIYYYLYFNLFSIMDQFVITVENFPSRSELYEIVDEHLRSSGLSDNYRSKNSDNLLKFIFTEEDSALSVLKRINLQKVENPLYKNTLAKFTIEQRKPFHVPAKSSSQLNVKLHPFKTLSTSLSTKKKNIMTTYGNVDRSYNHVHLLDITSKAGIITTASPYMTEDEKYIKKQQESKKNNISKKQFRLYFGKATSNRERMIKNYVVLTPTTETALTHKFREENKAKWVGKKNFSVI